MKYLIQGNVLWDDSGAPVTGATVTIYEVGRPEPVGESKTGREGEFTVKLHDCDDKDCGLRIYARVSDKEGKLLVSTHETPALLATKTLTLHITVPAAARLKGRVRPQIQVGPMLLNAEAVAKARPQAVLDLAKAMVDPKHEERVQKSLSALSPDLVPSRHINRTLCGTELLETIDALIKLKGWPRDVALQVDDILRMRHLLPVGFATQIHDCPNFRVEYQDSGAAMVNPDTTGRNVLDPGTSNVIGVLPSGGPPTYIKLICFWLERALATYINPPFSMRNPAAGGKIPVVVNSGSFGSASSSGTFYINNALPDEVVCAVAVHELFHMVQYQYSGSGTWRPGMSEGGATWAEDTAADFMNRYLDEAGTNFNGSGYMIQPHTSLENAGFRYKTSLFWRYIAEQHSPRINAGDEPLIGVETYRTIIEQCEAGSWSSNDIRQALRSLPWYQDFYEFDYLDPARQDLTRAETTLGNFALACYLKDLGINTPDRRFDFMEDEENIHIDDVINAMLGTPLQTTLASVARTPGTVTSGTSATFSSTIDRFASRYYEITVDPLVISAEAVFTASGGLSSCIFQLILINDDGTVRDIYRTDRTSYTKRFPNVRGGKRLDKIVAVVTGAASSGSFTLAVNPAAAAPDVMVTRWHSVMENEYEINSLNWAWTWVSPDIWVDNDLDGLADGTVYFNYDNKLHIRLHNKGNANASGISVDFWYQDASGGLSNAGWLPVQNTGGITQSLSGLSLAAGATQDWSVDWSPMSSGTSHHFCIRAVVTVPGDPNTDNKRVLSNFGNVVVLFAPGKFIDISLLRRNIDLDRPRLIELAVVPRLTPGLEIAKRDLVNQKIRLLQPGEAVQDVLRLSYWPVKADTPHTHADTGKDKEKSPCPCQSAEQSLKKRPDINGYYPVDPRTLPPGVAGKPLVTVVHLADGMPVGGVTMMVTLEKEEKKVKSK